RQGIEGNLLGIPQRKVLPGGDMPIPHYIVADNAFALKLYMMKPYSHACLAIDEKICNKYRFSKARRIVENAFGILANRFRVFRSPMALGPEDAGVVTSADCDLHNYIR